LVQTYSHDLVVKAMRQVLETARQAILAGEPAALHEVLMPRVAAVLKAQLQPTLRPVINATGIIIHTNLGRALLSSAARAAMDQAARGYSNLEYDLETGKRGSRYVHAEELLCRLTGAEAALVVNNNAGAVLLILSALAREREVIISRGQLVEIGGGFRIPDVMKQSGAILVEVGATNRTHLRDYEAAITDRTAMLLRAHRSNFRMTGFVTEPSLAEMSDLAHSQGLLVGDDLGSGTLLDTADYGLSHEPTTQESLAARADIVSCSGDKLLGGPQAGIILGRAELIAQLRRFPLTRALRVDKTTLAGLQATLLHYLKDEASQKVPVWRMISIPLETLASRAKAWVGSLAAAGLQSQVVAGRSAVGGGSLPGETLPTWLVALHEPSPARLVRTLYHAATPIIARIEDDCLVLDPRTVQPEEEKTLLETVVSAAQEIQLAPEGRGLIRSDVTQSRVTDQPEAGMQARGSR
jgi:L-seryl-tRNA(Ser) seleniumtransferase